MNVLKICLISFDNWHYDSFIIEALRKKNIDAYHIKLGAYKHASLMSRIINAFNKIILRKNHINIGYVIMSIYICAFIINYSFKSLK